MINFVTSKNEISGRDGEVLSRLVDISSISSWVGYMHIPDESKLDLSPIDMGRRPTVLLGFGP